MKKRLYLTTTILLSIAMLGLSSCLKDSRFVDLTKVGTIVEFPFGGQVFFGQQAVTQAPDTDAKGTIVLQFAVNVASPSVPTTATNITYSVNDPAIITAYNTAHTAVFYNPMPTNAYSFTQTSVTVPAGQRSTVMTVTFYKNLLDPSQSYMLPIAIKSAGGVNISGNQGIMYYHFIGNTFAGAYNQTFLRYNNFSTPPPVGTPPSGGSITPAQPITIFPITPNEFAVTTGYIGNVVNYNVTFNQIDATHFNNFQIVLNSDDVANLFTPSGITVTQPPVFGFDPANPTNVYDPTVSLTKAQAQALFTFQFTVQNSAGYRWCVDNYVPQ
jgi:hypothetical protein